MSITIPTWLVGVLVVAVWLFGSWASLVDEALSGRSMGRRYIVSLVIAALWPLRVPVAIIKLLIARQ